MYVATLTFLALLDFFRPEKISDLSSYVNGFLSETVKQISTKLCGIETI